jgi:hypothetical protein
MNQFHPGSAAIADGTLSHGSSVLPVYLLSCKIVSAQRRWLQSLSLRALSVWLERAGLSKLWINASHLQDFKFPTS